MTRERVDRQKKGRFFVANFGLLNAFVEP